MKLSSEAEVNLAQLTLGELLRKKAEDGVRVLLMIWGETTSIMGTHDTETENYFKGELESIIAPVFKYNFFVNRHSGVRGSSGEANQDPRVQRLGRAFHGQSGLQSPSKGRDSRRA